MSVNQVNLMGRIGNIETKVLTNNNAVTNFSIATTETWKDKQTQNQQSKTDWHHCVAYGKTAEFISQYFTKGSEIFVTGKLQTRKWQDQQGQDKYRTEVNVSNVSFTGGSKVGNTQGDYQQNQGQQSQAPQGFDDPFDSDIPF